MLFAGGKFYIHQKCNMVKHTGVGGGGGAHKNRPCILGIFIYEKVKLERQAGLVRTSP